MLKTYLAASGLALLATGAAAANDLSDEALSAILTALDDEYHAVAVYDALIDEFGENTVFSNIVEAEEKHADALIRLLTKYDQPIPENPYLEGTKALEPLPDTLLEAYEAGVEGEIVNIALYEEQLLPAVTEYPDVTRVFTALMRASETRHLPTFTACTENRCAGSGASRKSSVVSSTRGRSGEGNRTRSQRQERHGKANGGQRGKRAG